jgi:hypothetical protein
MLTQEIKMNLRVMIQNPKDCSQPIDVAAVEKRYGGTYIGDFCLYTTNNGWSEVPAAVFYQPNPNRELGHTNYFGMFVRNINTFIGEGELYITKGDSAFKDDIAGVIADGEIIYSCYRHDYHTSTDKSVSIDGGRDYTRFRGNPNRICKLVMKDGKLEVDMDSVQIEIPSNITIKVD